MRSSPALPTLRYAATLAVGIAVGVAGTLWLGPTADVPTLSSAHPLLERLPQVPTEGTSHRVKLTQILAANDKEFKPEDLRRLGTETAASDLAAALKLADGIPAERDRSSFLRGVFESWAQRAPADAAQYALSHFKSGQLQAQLLQATLGKWGGSDARNAYAWAETHLQGPLKLEAINSLVNHWAKNAPEAAALWYTQTGSTSTALLQAVLGPWAATDPTAAAAWVETFGNKGNLDPGRKIIAQELAATDPPKALAYVKPFLAATPDLPTNLMDLWGTKDPAAAAANLDQFPPGKIRQEAAATLASVWAATDIHAAVTWSASLTDPLLHAIVVQQLGTTWGASEPDQALAWLDTLPPTISQNGYRGAYNSWACTDPISLMQWIHEQPDTNAASNDLARRSLADAYSSHDPVAALDLALGIQSPNTQADAVASYYTRWITADPPSANDWLASTWETLPPTTRSRLDGLADF